MAAGMVASGEYKPATVTRLICLQYGDEAGARIMRYLYEYEDWQRGGLLVDGGLESQPAKWLQRCWIIDGVYSSQRRKDLEKARKGNSG
jgi:hypothetical protein